MNNLRKVGLTALAASLATVSAHATELTVAGSASIYYSAQEDANSTGFYQNDKITLTGSGTLDNGIAITMGLSIDQSDVAADQAATGRTFEGRYIKFASDSLGTLTFNGQDGSSVTSAWDDMMPTAYEESHNSADSPDDYSDSNSFYYSNAGLADGVNLVASFAPGGNGNNQGSLDVGVQLTAIEGLTLGLAVGEDASIKNAEVDYTTMYATYTWNSMTLGVQMNDSDDATANADQEFSAAAISYAVSDDLTVSYGMSSIDYETAGTPDQDANAVSASYTMGSIGFVGSYNDIENATGGTADNDNYKSWEVGLTFAF
jgi:outer membrane protein OmpU